MEIRIRRWLPPALVTGLAILLGVVLLPAAAPRLAWLRPTPGPTPAAGAESPPGGPAITYRDDSLTWDWQADCAAQFRAFLATQLADQAIHSVEVVLVDRQPDRPLPFGIRYPDANGPKSVGNCYNQGQGAFLCYTAIAEGVPGAALDVAVVANAPYTLLDMALARGPDPNVVRRSWGFETLAPLISPGAEGENRWQSSCLHVSQGR